MILIEMPGIKKRVARYPQLYSRIGFAHRYYALQGEELAFLLKHHWKSLGPHLAGADFTDAQAMATVARITGGNFRLLQRLFVQLCSASRSSRGGLREFSARREPARGELALWCGGAHRQVQLL